MRSAERSAEVWGMAITSWGLTRPVGKARKPRGGVGANAELLNCAKAGFVAPCCGYELLDVQIFESKWVKVIENPVIMGNIQLASPEPVAPLRVS